MHKCFMAFAPQFARTEWWIVCLCVHSRLKPNVFPVCVFCCSLVLAMYPRKRRNSRKPTTTTSNCAILSHTHKYWFENLHHQIWVMTVALWLAYVYIRIVHMDADTFYSELYPYNKTSLWFIWFSWFSVLAPAAKTYGLNYTCERCTFRDLL